MMITLTALSYLKSKEEEMIDSRHVPLELRRYSDLSQLNNKAQNDAVNQESVSMASGTCWRPEI